MLASRLPWESIAAFGEPAVPLVNMSTGEVVGGAVDDRDGVAGSQVGHQQLVEVALALAVDHELEHRAARARSRRGATSARPPRADDAPGRRRRPARARARGRAQRVERHRHHAGAEHRQVAADEVPVVAADDADRSPGVDPEARPAGRSAATCSRRSCP